MILAISTVSFFYFQTSFERPTPSLMFESHVEVVVEDFFLDPANGNIVPGKNITHFNPSYFRAWISTYGPDDSLTIQDSFGIPLPLPDLQEEYLKLARSHGLARIDVVHAPYWLTVRRIESMEKDCALDSICEAYFVAGYDESVVPSGLIKEPRQKFFNILVSIVTSQTVVPILIGLPFVVFLIIYLTTRPLQKAVKMASQIRPRDLAVRLPTKNIPTEILPLVSAMNAALERLDKGYKSLGQFSAAAAHELRTPLGLINIYLDELPNTETKRKLQLTSNRLQLVVNQILSLSLIRQNSVDFVVFDLILLTREVIADRAPHIADHGLDIEFHSDLSVRPVMGLRMAIFSAIGNLIDNAVTHAPNSPMILVSVTNEGVSVIDGGPGVDGDFESIAFKPHTKYDSNSAGFGLGLSIVSEVMRLHNGSINIRPVEGGGSLFFLSFPRVD